MAATSSFDITSTIDFQEVDNGLNQARKEVGQRYDFKGSTTDIDLGLSDKTLTLTTDDEMKMNALWEIVQTRLVRRHVPIKNFKRVQAAIQAEQVRVTSPSKDDLQEAIRALRDHDFGVALQFGNYR